MGWAFGSFSKLKSRTENSVFGKPKQTGLKFGDPK
uniref:Uncharacterized protein n=1 Tax=Setaria italica TaxID=4555 RepID=K4APB9_SETIT